MQKIENPIFIGGLMKSGTTLMRKMLGNHQNLFGGLETHWFEEDFISKYKTGDSKRHEWFKEFYEVPDDVLQSIRSAAGDAYEFLNLALTYCAQKEQKKRWIEKTPGNVFNLNTIYEHFPSAKVIILRRDLRDVYSSWKKNKKLSLGEFIDQAETYTKVINSFANNSSLLVVDYEQLIHNTEKTISDVSVFLEESFDEAVGQYAGDSSDYEKLLKITGKASATAESLKSPIFSSSIGQYKDNLSEDEIAKIEQIIA